MNLQIQNFSMTFYDVSDCERSLIWGEKGVGGTALAASHSQSADKGPQYAWLGNRNNATQVKKKTH